MQSDVNKFVERLRLECIVSEQQKAEETLCLLEKIVSSKEWKSHRELLDKILNVSKVAEAVMPWETTSCNMVHRVLKIVQDEVQVQSYSTDKDRPSTHILNVSLGGDVGKEESIDIEKLRENVLSILLEQRAEIEQYESLIATQGESRIHSDEIILTVGYCPSVQALLSMAAKKRHFHTIVAEGAPKYDGHLMAKKLSSQNIQTTLIQDSAIFPMMSRINKVIIGAHTVFYNGGIRASVGTSALALAAKFYSVPLYICAPPYKFSKESNKEAEYYNGLNVLNPPLKDVPSDVNIPVAKFDYVPPEHINIFITSNRGLKPSYVYREVTKLYHVSSDDF